MFGVVCDNYTSKLKGKQYKQNTSPKSYKSEIKILANPGPGWVSLIRLWTTRPCKDFVVQWPEFNVYILSLPPCISGYAYNPMGHPMGHPGGGGTLPKMTRLLINC